MTSRRVVGRHGTAPICKRCSRAALPCYRNCLHSVRGRFRQAVRRALKARSKAVRVQDPVREARGWKLFCLLPVWLLRRSAGTHRVSKEELLGRFDLFSREFWADLMHEAQSLSNQRRVSHPVTVNADDQRAEAACRKVQLGEVSRARQCLTGAALAPGTDATFTEMQSKRPQEVLRRILGAVLDFVPESPPEVDRKIFLKNLKSAPREASPGPGGCTYEHLRVVLDDPDTLDLLSEGVTSLAQASVPEEITVALLGARLTALAKSDGGVRGIATGSSLKRLVARTLAKQFASEFQAECAPFQYA